MNLKQKINYTKSNLHEELDLSEDYLKTLNYETDFGSLMAYTTRIKILKSLINCFKLIRKNKQNEIQFIIDGIRKRIKIHLYQIKKLTSKDNYMENRTYFINVLKVIMCFMFDKFKISN